jgi:polyisoprenoid-binding protein YceI
VIARASGQPVRGVTEKSKQSRWTSMIAGGLRGGRGGLGPVPSPGGPKRRWLRWALGACAAAVVLVVAVAALAFALAPVPALYTLPTGQAAPPTGPLAGTWVTGAGSEAGFRMAETVLFITKDNVAGSTGAVSGSFLVTRDGVARASFQVDLRTVKVGGKTQAQFAKSMGTARHPYATFVLVQKVPLSPAFASGATVHMSVTGRLNIHGVSHPVTFATSERRDGTALQVAGSVPVSLATWGIRGPAGLGPVGSLADHGVAEFVLQLHRN